MNHKPKEVEYPAKAASAVISACSQAAQDSICAVLKPMGPGKHKSSNGYAFWETALYILLICAAEYTVVVSDVENHATRY